jgi:hypothetical protein
MAVKWRGLGKEGGGDGNGGKRTKKTDVELVRAGKLRNKGVNVEQRKKGGGGHT